MAVSRLEKIKNSYDDSVRWHRIRTETLTWLIEQVEDLQKQIARMQSTFIITDAQRQVEAAHQALDELGVPNDGKSSLTERIMYLVSEK